MPKLIIQERGHENPWTHECVEEAVTIGRLPDNIVQLKSKGVSREHAKIIADGENFFLLDLKSGNGTLLNGIPIKTDEKYLLQAGDKISIDVFDIKFHEGEELPSKANEEVTGSDILEVKLLKKVISAIDKDMVPSIEVLNGSAEGKKIFFTDEMSEIVIGRDPDCDFPVNEHVISRKHARLIKRWGGIAIRDLESTNGSFLNNRRVIEEFLHDGDRIALGTIVMLFRNPQEINLASFGDIKPRNRPAMVEPQEIPGLESEALPPEGQEFEEEEPGEKPQAIEEAESALEEWDELEKSVSKIEPYPVPQARVERIKIKKFTLVEMGLIGVGALFLIFALITIVNLLAS